MGKRINAQDAISLLPGVSPSMHPLTYAGGQPIAGSTTSNILRTNMFSFSNDDESYERQHLEEGKQQGR
jgi:hypothetical protein